MTLTTADTAVGDTHTQVLVEDLTRTQIVMYAGASGDYNPLHSDERYAVEAAGFPGVFAHGMLTMGMTGRAVTDLVGADHMVRFGGRFKSQVWPGDTLTATVTVDAVRDEGDEHLVDLTVVTVNQKGDEVFAGAATARID
ncbi:MAG TPA: MaoC/PaaZ C-terminal domain-containing protein [Acidimicrobiales bacterium]|jgi:acyl dehydratase